MTTLGSLVRVASNPRIPYVCEPVDQSIKRSVLLCSHFPFFGWGIVGAFGDSASPSGGRHPVAKGPATLCPPSLGLDRKLLNLALPAAGGG